MLPPLPLSQTQQNWLTIAAFAIAVLQWLNISPLPWLRLLLHHLGRPGRHLERRWRHRLARIARLIAQDARIYYAGLWKRLFLVLMILGALLILFSTLPSEAGAAAQDNALFLFGLIIYLASLNGGTWAMTYATPAKRLSSIRKQLIETQRDRHAKRH
jgi:hypothetical protein